LCFNQNKKLATDSNPINNIQWTMKTFNIINFIIKTDCMICSDSYSQKNSFWICDECWSKVRKIPSPSCVKCESPIPECKSTKIDDPVTCGNCTLFIDNIDKFSSYGIYEDVLKTSIHAFKYNRNMSIGEILSEFALSAFEKRFINERIDYIIPVPLHTQKLRGREFNQSSIFSQKIAKKYNFPILYDILIRKRFTKSQTDLTVNQRMDNIEGAFDIKPKKILDPLLSKLLGYFGRYENGTEIDLENKRVLLVDDVMTTGITTNECASSLKKAGVSFVGVVTVAKTCY
jgi:competence protein ComFC